MQIAWVSRAFTLQGPTLDFKAVGADFCMYPKRLF